LRVNFGRPTVTGGQGDALFPNYLAGGGLFEAPENVGGGSAVSLLSGGAAGVDDVSAQEALEVAVLVVLEHDARRVVVEAHPDQPRDVAVVQARHDPRLTLEILSSGIKYSTGY